MNENMNEKMFSFLLKSLENSSQTVFLMNAKEKYPFFANKQAQKHYCLENGTVEINSIFTNKVAIGHFSSTALEQLQKKGYAMLYDVSTTTNTNEIKICDIQLKYCDDQQEIIFLELFHKEDTRMESMLEQVNKSQHAEGIFNLDSSLSFVHCNDYFYDIFDSNQEDLAETYQNQLVNCFHIDVRENLQKEIQQKLVASPVFSTKIKIITSKGREKWCSLDLQRRTLDNSGVDKILVFMVDIEDQVEIEEQLHDISEYFSALETMTNGIIYRFDIRTRTLYRSEKTAKLYNVPTVAEKFPQREWLEKVLHPDDIDGYITFMDRVYQGKEDSYTARFATAQGILEYHLFTFKPIHSSDGSIKEMVGSAVNVQDKHELEATAQNVKKQFDILERVCEDRLSFIDFKTRMIIHNESHAADIGVEVVEGRFPETIIPRVHPDDLQDFLAFAESNLNGVEGEFTFRMMVDDINFQWFEIAAFIVCDEMGTPEQIVARIKNVHSVQELQSKVADFNKQFDIIEKISQETMIQVDINTKVLVHRGNHAAQIGVNNVEENFPECVFPRVHPDELGYFKKYTDSLMNGQEGDLTFRMKVVGQENEYEWFQLDCHLIYDNEGKAEQIVGTVKNVHSHQEMIKRANTDMLTGCLNKMAILEKVEEILQTSTSSQKHALFFMDLDEFKYVNDNLGHAFGDYLLQELGKRLFKSIRNLDFLGRVGGDEFVIFLRDINNTDILMGKAKMLLSAISEDFNDGTNRHTIHGSLGVAVFPDHGTSYEELYHHADLALYRSKHKGKNQVTLFSEDLKQ